VTVTERPRQNAAPARPAGSGTAVLEKKLEVLSRRVADLARTLERRSTPVAGAVTAESGPAEGPAPDTTPAAAEREHQTPVRASTRCSPVDSVQLRRIVGRILIRAVRDRHGQGAVAVRSEHLEIGADNELSLLPGRYSRISIPFTGHERPAAVIDEIFASCYLVSPRLSLPGSSRHLWLTTSRDGAIVVEPRTPEGACVHVYLSAGGNLWQEAAATEPAVAGPGGSGIEALLLRRGGQACVTAADGQPLVLYRLPRASGPDLLCAVEHMDTLAGDRVGRAALA
jgi:hypothetical protein